MAFIKEYLHTDIFKLLACQTFTGEYVRKYSTLSTKQPKLSIYTICLCIYFESNI